ncbi:FAD-dependent oxidoreductase [Streptococcus dentiloxodontae]
MSRKTDVVIVGAGAAGLGAGITIAESGMDVIILEKGDKYGGAGMFGAQGLFAAGSEDQKKAGITYSSEDAYKEMLDYTHYRSDSRIAKVIFDKSADTIAWLRKRGLDTELVNNTQEAHQEHPRVYHQYIDKFNGFKRLMDNFISHGGILLTETAGQEIIQENGIVKGIKVLHDGRIEKITCKAIILCDGGYVGDAEMVAQHLAINFEDFYSMGERKATGDGIRMAASIGADTSSLGQFENHAATVISKKNRKWNNPTIFTLTNLPFLWINQEGERFVDESIVYDFALWGNVTYISGGYYYYLLEQNTVDYLREKELEWTNSFERTFATLAHTEVTQKVGPFPTIDSDLNEAIQEEAAYKVNSLEELADILDVPTENLIASISSYNEAIEIGEDNDFGKNRKYLRFKVANGPFYAIRPRTTSLGTLGGIKANQRFEVLTPKGKTISGLYVAGNNAAGMYDNSYPTLEGVSCAFAWNSGRIAGESIVTKYK